MIQLPVFTYLRVENYGLFPGKPAGKGIEWIFDKGLCLIAGINGLGKTTLLTMLLRVFTGPYDLTGEGAPEEYDSVLPETPVPLKPRAVRFFAQRVANKAINSSVTVRATLGNEEIEITRRLSDLRLASIRLDGKDRDLDASRVDREAVFQKLLCRLFNLSSFVDVLLVLHQIVFFSEYGSGALWDENAQRHVLRALVLDKDLAARVAAAERHVGSADSRARNIRASAFPLEQKLLQMRSTVANSSGIGLQLAAEQKLLDAELKERERLNGLLAELDEQRKEERREYEQAKLDREEAEGTVESFKFALLSRLFPRMEDTARLVVLKTLTGGHCLVCGAEAEQKQRDLEAQLARGECPSCGAPPERQETTSPAFKVDEARVREARKAARLAQMEEVAARKRFVDSKSQYEDVLQTLLKLNTSIQDRKLRERRLSAELPPAAEEIVHLQKSLELTRRAQRQAESERAAAAKTLGVLLKRGSGDIEKQSKKLAVSFKRYAKNLIAEDAELVRITGKARLTQGNEIFDVPAFRPKMSAADRPAKPLRNAPDDVSESQRELIELAFRLGLIEIATQKASCSLAMETPEASLDELAMHRVGLALHKFADSSDNRLVVTSNLTNAGMITWMFGGPSNDRRELDRRQSHTINLLEIAAPNHALTHDRSKYQNILKAAMRGRPKA
jgi:hypothetical protein